MAFNQAFLDLKRAQEVIDRDPIKERIEHYESQPLPPGIPEHIVKCTERRKLLKQGPFFKIPTWASMPTFGDAHFEVIKEGDVVNTWPLQKWAYCLIGKNPAVCEYVMEHPTTSGVHCAIVFHGEQRQFYVIDLSTNGTQLNGQKLVKGQPVPIPFESSIVVGLSTRTLVLKKVPMSQAQAKRHEAKNKDLTVSDPFPPLPSTQASNTLLSPLSNAPSASVIPTAAAEAPPPAAVASVATPPPEDSHIKRHFRHLLVKHVDVADPVSKAPRNKGDPITRSLADAVELASSLRSVLMANGSSCTEEMFAQYCEQYSECKSAKKGGDLGVIAKGDMDAEFDRPAFRLVPGAVSAPVTTDLGVHLIFRCPE